MLTEFDKALIEFTAAERCGGNWCLCVCELIACRIIAAQSTAEPKETRP